MDRSLDQVAGPIAGFDGDLEIGPLAPRMEPTWRPGARCGPSDAFPYNPGRHVLAGACSLLTPSGPAAAELSHDAGLAASELSANVWPSCPVAQAVLGRG